MARKGNQQKNSVDRHTSSHRKRGLNSGSSVPVVTGRGRDSNTKVFPGEELPNGNHPGTPSMDSAAKAHHAGDENTKMQNSLTSLRTEMDGADVRQDLHQLVSSNVDLGDCTENISSTETLNVREAIARRGRKHGKSGLGCLLKGLHVKNAMENVKFSDNLLVKSLRAYVASISKTTIELLERQGPLLGILTTNLCNACDYVRMKFQKIYPVVLILVKHFVSIILLLLMVWLNCNLRGIDSFLRMGTTSFFSVIWCSILSVIAMVGMSKFLMVLNIHKQRGPDRPSEETSGMQGGPGFFSGEPAHASSSNNVPGLSADRSPGVPSTSGTDSEMTSEDEVARLLNCTDHYSALGLSRYENVDVTVLKREYRKRAMLVHPDKNMGNEKAVEAFKKLQSAYEVLLDSLKRKAYDDELRREELLNCFRRFQSASQKNGRHGIFASGSAWSEANSEDPIGDARQIACKKCSNFHVWIETKKSKSRARWCQECKDYHQAKDGDGWVEQSSQPFFFGLLQKVDVPSAYVCAENRIYNATEWYICQRDWSKMHGDGILLQGMRCPANTHKPSFHVNTSLTSKHNAGKGTSSGPRSGRMPSNLEETMTEEEFVEWLQNAVQSGLFENFGGSTSTSTESPSAKAGTGSKGNGTNNSSGSKRKKKGKKQW